MHKKPIPIDTKNILSKAFPLITTHNYKEELFFVYC